MECDRGDWFKYLKLNETVPGNVCVKNWFANR
jgi:hypothetical protein